jgi:guanosine-3',5'-bis(diphosphate) 3'-pyrophosphohydrolase
MTKKDDLKVIFEALTYAAKMHSTQRRKDNRDTPYINHPIDVAKTLITVGGITDPNVIAAALLHDTVEDTEATVEDIDRLFGSTIRSLVMECTDDKSLPKEERKRLQVTNAPHKSESAKCIKLSDKISNVKDIGEYPPVLWSKQRLIDYLDWTEEVIKGLRGANKSLEELYDKTLEKSREKVLAMSDQSK